MYRLVNNVEGRSIGQIFRYPDNLKFRSCMTLFAYATSNNHIFMEALRKYFSGNFDRRTVIRIELRSWLKKSVALMRYGRRAS
jgi:uncharacterized protein (DUF1810 family)